MQQSCIFYRTLQFVVRMKLQKLFFVCLIISVLFTSVILLLYQKDLTWIKIDKSKLPRIIWWTPFTLREELEILDCGNIYCAISDNRHFMDGATAYLFYGSNLQNWDLPIPRKSNHIWGLFHEESPKNIGLFLDERALKLFNITSTFSRHSDIPLTLQHLTSIDDLTSLKYYVSTREKNIFRENGLAPVLYIQSDCETPLNRDSYVEELMKYIKVDSYGKCLKNKDLPSELNKEDHLEDLFDVNLMKLVAKYKFTLSIENAACDDYVTEKIWRPLMAGSVPIYLGSKTIRDWLPDNSKSAVLIDHFKTPRQLAEHLKILDEDNRKYERHLQHKLSDTYPITNELLKRAISRGFVNDTTVFIHKFECSVCEVILGVSSVSGANKIGVDEDTALDYNVYRCPKPISAISRQENSSNWWLHHWNEAPCHFKAVNRIIEENLKNFTEKQYNEEVFSLYQQRKC